MMTLARPHYVRWVRGGLLIVTLGYAISAAVSLMLTPADLAGVAPELMVVGVGLVGFGLLARGHVAKTAWIVLGAVWLEIHHGIYSSASLLGAGVVVLPAFVIGAGLFAGERVALRVAAITAITAPLAGLAGHLLIPRPVNVVANIHEGVVLANVLLGVAYLTALALRAVAAVLTSAQTSTRRFAELIQKIPDGIVAVDGGGSITSVNPAACALLDASPVVLTHRPLSRVLEERHVHPPPATWLSQRGKPALPLTLERPAGDIVRAEASIQDLQREDGPNGALVVFRDVTEQHRAERHRAELQEQLQHAQRMEALGHFAGGLAHDFNNVLHVVLGHLDLATLRLTPGHPVLRDLHEIRQATTRAGGLIRQLLTYARRQTCVPRNIDLNAVVTSLVPLLRPLLPESITLKPELHPDLSSVRADPGQIEQVVVNLVVNARDAMPNGGVLCIATEHRVLDQGAADRLGLPAARYVALSVTDTGIGMSAEVLARLFEPFFTTKKDGRGTGLGLATVFGIVKQARGHIHAESEAGRGSTFHVLLPIAEGPADVEGVSAAQPTQGPRGTETVLLVEDDPQVRRLNAIALRTQGYRVLEATDGVEALGLAAEAGEVIHILVTDVIMPRLGGLDLARQIEAVSPGILVLFASGYGADAIADEGVLPPGIQLLSKPFSPQELAFRVRHLLGEGPGAACPPSEPGHQPIS
jgi:two-component system cell cycle sensor histidine kinase/response regulator CckA